jgi:hypothetical protein
MAALTPTLSKRTEFAGDQKILIFTVTPEADGDTIDLSSYFSTIYGVIGYLTAGLDANLTLLIPSFSGTTVTIAQKKADGATAASDWTGASITLWVLGEASGV